MIHGAYHGNWLAILLSHENGNLGMRHKPVLHQQLLELLLQLECAEAGCGDLVWNKGKANLPSVAYPHVSRKLRHVEDINVHQIADPYRSFSRFYFGKCRKRFNFLRWPGLDFRPAVVLLQRETPGGKIQTPLRQTFPLAVP